MPVGYPGRSLEAAGNSSSREMVITPQGVQNPAYNCPYEFKRSSVKRPGTFCYSDKEGLFYFLNSQSMEKNKIKNIVLRVEIIIGVLAVILGLGSTIYVWNEGYFVGTLMMVVTGMISVFLGVKELVAPVDNMLQWLPLFFIIIRRTFFFLNLVLCAFVVGTFTNLI